MLPAETLEELRPLSAWAHRLGLPDPVRLLDDELTAADTDGMRASAELVWGTTGVESPMTRDVALLINSVADRFTNGVADRWEGASYDGFAQAIDNHRAAVRLALDRSAVMGDASIHAADSIEWAYSEAVIACVDASSKVAALAAGLPANQERIHLAIADVITSTVDSVADRCEGARRETDELTPRLKALTHPPNAIAPERAEQPTWDSDPNEWQPAGHESARQQTGVVYVVAEGDSLWSIAARNLGEPTRWPEIYALNADQIADPNLIHPGQHLQLPADQPADATGAPEPGDPPRSHTAPTPPPVELPEPEPPVRVPEPPPAEDPAPPPTTPIPPEEPTTQPHEPDLRLPSGAWVAVGLAAAVLAAWALALLRRHPRMRVRGVRDLDLPSEPPLVGALRRLLGRQADTRPPGDPRYGAALPPIGNGPVTNTADCTRGGLGLTGPGAASAARAAIAGTVCAGGPLTPDQRGTVVITAAMLTALLDTPDIDAKIADLPRLVALPSAEETTQWLQVEIVRRRRLLNEHGAATVDGLAAADPFAAPLAPVLAVLPAPPANQVHALKALLDEGSPLSISAIVLGDWQGAGVFVDGDGFTTALGQVQQCPDRLSTLTPADLRDALHVAAAAAEAPRTATDDDLLLTPLTDTERHEQPGPVVEPQQSAPIPAPAGVSPSSNGHLAGPTAPPVAGDEKPDIEAELGESRARGRTAPDTDREAPPSQRSAVEAPAPERAPSRTGKLVQLCVSATYGSRPSTDRLPRGYVATRLLCSPCSPRTPLAAP